jgi:hypothetical protein
MSTRQLLAGKYDIWADGASGLHDRRGGVRAGVQDRGRSEPEMSQSEQERPTRQRGNQKGVAQMGWEDRNGNAYYYRKRREGKRVVSEYVGNGLIAQIAQVTDMEERAEIENKRAELREQKELAQVIDSQVNKVEQYARVITRGHLLLAGYHTHKAQWRKRRNGRSKDNND